MKKIQSHRSLSKNGFQRLKQAEKIAHENDKIARKLIQTYNKYKSFLKYII